MWEPQSQGDGDSQCGKRSQADVVHLAKSGLGKKPKVVTPAEPCVSPKALLRVRPTSKVVQRENCQMDCIKACALLMEAGMWIASQQRGTQ
ncbi:hypothetical protein llap_2040 [Limosa lapponica baueri]|uniref:Uncharacterized protein n=1 Tax=Limosa lapponica baueri TaxID=1758121 RepID=A0A2I0UNL4_LIMLA|nr:hypothetical protein llap_2040 [Limosa lapponica baueri]